MSQFVSYPNGSVKLMNGHEHSALQNLVVAVANEAKEGLKCTMIAHVTELIKGFHAAF
jgi:hypothetical protein